MSRSSKWIRSRERYEGSNFWYCPKDNEATSYNWWYVLRELDGVLIFNSLSYSPSTSRHVTAIRELVGKGLGHKPIDLAISSNKNITGTLESYLSKVIREHKEKIANLETKASRARSRKQSIEESIDHLTRQVRLMENLINNEARASANSLYGQETDTWHAI